LESKVVFQGCLVFLTGIKKRGDDGFLTREKGGEEERRAWIQ